MNRGCPNLNCQSREFIKDGFYFRKNDSRKIRRYKCSKCNKKFSASTFQLEYRQKKRRVNYPFLKLYASGISLRKISKLLGIHQITAKRKLNYLAMKANMMNMKQLKDFEKFKIRHIQIDDLITIEHTKLKPLSVSTAVCADSRLILGNEVSQIPAFGHLARFSRKKYGERPSKHREGLERLFSNIKKYVIEKPVVSSDEHLLYPEFVNRHFPNAVHKRYKSERGCVTGQGELKKKKFDPIFSINHTYAMLRANINRLFRRSWCTTKDPKELKKHLDIYSYFHNKEILENNFRTL